MRRAGALALTLGLAPALSGCIAAAVAVPLAAAGTITKSRLDGASERTAERGGQTAPAPAPAASDPLPSAAPAPLGPPVQAPEGVVAGVVSGPLPAPGGPAPLLAGQAAPPSAPPPGMQYLYGSGEGAALSLQAYQMLWSYLSARAKDRKAGLDIRGVVLARDGSLEVPRFVPCGTKPLAAVFDIDETVLLNLGYEADEARRGAGYDDDRWRRWEATGAPQVAAVPGAAETIDAARRAGIVIVFNSNRSQANTAGTIAALQAAGLGSAEPGKTLWLREDGFGKSGKDSRRWEIAEKYCVVALVGDQLGDFSDLFNPGGVPVPVRRNMASETMVSAMWGSGWFLLPNPVYGTGLHGSFDDVFPRDKRWIDPADIKDQPAAPPAPAAASNEEGSN
ncbi:5'-nucleotidase, lipoprotein e(P4) family [Sphingomonas canadensis]|uniref:5'-nucleotidase, lipoprotein e(P4) family n=1 Tax=Sphingomonas canadensis TaxID=1219257 RepID=A0ABW3H4Q2_9SPHN|nr:HAD family acid phosphatase [Sphingomonas canadensis]MCW3836128.1 acid phosphatase [Sphingomonas canadensis]